MITCLWALPLKPQVSAFAFKHTQHGSVIGKAHSTTTLHKHASCQPIQMKDIALSRKHVMLLNHRRLKGLSKRGGNHDAVLHLMAECYPHLSLPKESMESNSTFTWTHEALLDILKSNTTESRLGDDMVIIDGRFLIGVIDKLRNSPISFRLSLNLLRLSLDGVIHNRQIRRQFEGQTSDEKDFSSQNVQDANELRQIYKEIISLVAHTNDISASVASRFILHLVHVHMPSAAQIQLGTEIYHAALNALGLRGKGTDVLDILGAMEKSCEACVTLPSVETSISKQPNHACSCTHQYPCVDQMSYQTAISSLSKSGCIETAISILYRMKSRGFSPDINCYNNILIGIAKAAGRASSFKNSEAKWHQVALQILQEMENEGLHSTEQAYNSVIASCTKEGAWSEAAIIDRKEKSMNVQSNNNSTSGMLKGQDFIESSNRVKNLNTNNNLSLITVYFKDLECYEKVGKGKDSWWKIGQCTRTDHSKIFIGIQPHKNPVRNGLSLVFYDEKSNFKLGRMLLKNSSSKRGEHHHKDTVYSSIVGMEVARSLRGQGLSKLFVACWLKICLIVGAYPRAALMNKPLISLVLMQFGFVPQEGGTCCELIRLDNEFPCIGHDETDLNEYTPTFGLYSSSGRSLQGVFSDRVLRTQHMTILNNVPQSARSKPCSIYVKTTFEHLMAISENAVDYNPPKEMGTEINRSLNAAFKRKMSQREILESQVRRVLPDDQLKFFASHSDLHLALCRFISS